MIDEVLMVRLQRKMKKRPLTSRTSWRVIVRAMLSHSLRTDTMRDPMRRTCLIMRDMVPRVSLGRRG